MDCSNAGDCVNGGYANTAFDYVRNGNHIASQNQYSYTATDGWCRENNYMNSMTIEVDSVNRITGGDWGLRNALSNGPTSVILLNFHGISVEAYKRGVLGQNKKPGNGPGAMAHMVVAVGYTSNNWELRNSWGTNWGINGYFWHDRTINNNIGISDYAYTITYTSVFQQEEKEE